VSRVSNSSLSAPKAHPQRFLSSRVPHRWALQSIQKGGFGPGRFARKLDSIDATEKLAKKGDDLSFGTVPADALMNANP
jgi:hypothetical protein